MICGKERGIGCELNCLGESDMRSVRFTKGILHAARGRGHWGREHCGWCQIRRSRLWPDDLRHPDDCQHLAIPVCGSTPFFPERKRPGPPALLCLWSCCIGRTFPVRLPVDRTREAKVSRYCFSSQPDRLRIRSPILLDRCSVLQVSGRPIVPLIPTSLLPHRFFILEKARHVACVT